MKILAVGAGCDAFVFTVVLAMPDPTRRAGAQEPSVRRLRRRAERWATVCSLIASAKLNDVEPFAYLKDILQRMTEGLWY